MADTAHSVGTDSRYILAVDAAVRKCFSGQTRRMSPSYSVPFRFDANVDETHSPQNHRRHRSIDLTFRFPAPH